MADRWSAAHARALLWIGYGGEEAGAAVADVLFGRVSPSGRLPVTFYTGRAQLPPFGSYDMRARPGRTYRFLTQPPLFYFGWGLSYTSFAYRLLDPPQAAPVSACSALPLAFDVTNTGDRAGDEVAQVYVRVGRAAEAPRLSLAGFARTGELAPGGRRRVAITVPPRALSVLVAAGRRGWVWEPGPVRVWIGGRQPSVEEVDGQASDLLELAFELAGPVRQCA